MLAVLIVDDEFEIREGLRKRFPWDEYGIQQVLTADDGISALEIARNDKPELIVTDIKMTRMSGLEFLHALFKDDSDYKPQSIVISGYDDFTLVKQALQIGVMDYILKPINLDELKLVVSKTTDFIYRKRLESQTEAQLHSHANFAIQKMREELLRELLKHECDSYWETRRRHRLHTLGLEWMLEGEMMLFIIEADDLRAIERQDIREKELIQFGIGNVVQQTLEEEYPYKFAVCMDHLSRLVVVLACTRPEQSELAEGIAILCLQRVNQFVKVQASAGMRSASGGLNQLREMFNEAAFALEQKAAYGGNRLFTDKSADEDEEQVRLSMKEPAEVIDLIKYGSDKDISAALIGFEDMVKSWHLTHIRDIQQQLFEWLYEVIHRVASLGISGKMKADNPIAIWEQLEQYDTLQSLRDLTERYLLDMAAVYRNQPAGISQIVSEAEKLIQRDYAENLSLQSVADSVHVTSVWLSKLFRKEKGVTFLEYLTAVRMENAKEMLGDVKYKVYQISYQVGYKDPVHFSKLFKRQVGCTPKEYRRQKGIAED
ncbi:response regulator [Paenibacillaceae bacterium]|nr:response regulator [Paenibacillaceae bacterium]